jgi:hypothetical protein
LQTDRRLWSAAITVIYRSQAIVMIIDLVCCRTRFQPQHPVMCCMGDKTKLLDQEAGGLAKFIGLDIRLTSGFTKQ